MTAITFKALRTVTHEMSDHVVTNGSINTGIRSAFIDIMLTVLAIIAKRTNASKLCHFIITGAAVFTGM
jgi:hypothetical protein